EDGAVVAGGGDQGPDVGLAQGRDQDRAAVGVADVRPRLEDVRVVGTEALGDLLGEAERRPARARGDLHAGLARSRGGLPDALLHLAVRPDHGAVAVEVGEREHGASPPGVEAGAVTTWAPSPRGRARRAARARAGRARPPAGPGRAGSSG